MLSIWILGVRDVRRPSQESYCVDNGPILWAVQVTNGSQQHRTQFLPLPAGQGEEEKVSHVFIPLAACGRACAFLLSCSPRTTLYGLYVTRRDLCIPFLFETARYQHGRILLL